MKYLVNLNGKNYEVDVTETKAEIVSTTLAPVEPSVCATVCAGQMMSGHVHR